KLLPSGIGTSATPAKSVAVKKNGATIKPFSTEWRDPSRCRSACSCPATTVSVAPCAVIAAPSAYGTQQLDRARKKRALRRCIVARPLVKGEPPLMAIKDHTKKFVFT